VSTKTGQPQHPWQPGCKIGAIWCNGAWGGASSHAGSRDRRSFRQRLRQRLV